MGSRGNDAEVSGKLVPFCAPFNTALAAVEALYRRPTLRLDCHASMGDENSSDRPKAGTWHAMYELWMGTFTTGRTSTKDAPTGQSWFGIFRKENRWLFAGSLSPARLAACGCYRGHFMKVFSVMSGCFDNNGNIQTQRLY